MTGKLAPLLSICMPTYNRCDMLMALVSGLLQQRGDFEICVHDDGSSDGTQAALAAISDPRLRFGAAPNQGRAAALMSACAIAHGRYIMPFDDDDTLFPEGLDVILADCATPPAHGTVGFIYQMVDDDGKRIGTSFPVSRSNFLALRADLGVTGDKKEIVLAQALREVVYRYDASVRRVPTSLLWSRMALEHDVVCRNLVVGRKTYLAGGMTAEIRRLKRGSPRPMADLYATHLCGFLRGRTRSIRHAARALLAFCYYRVLCAIAVRR